MIRLVPKRTLAWLMHIANQSPSDRMAFYALKEQLLRQYGTLIGFDTQEITRDCWGVRQLGCSGETCRRCNGSGIYMRKWIELERWQWGHYIFHRPIRTMYRQPEQVDIIGRIPRSSYGRRNMEAELWLYLVTCNWRVFWHALSTTSFGRPGWWPLCRLQRIAMRARMTLERRRCIYCNRRFTKWGTGWQICRRCRATQDERHRKFAEALEEDDIPF